MPVPLRSVPVTLCAAALVVSAAHGADAQRRPADEDDREWFLLPVIANAPETGLQLGAMAMRFLPRLSRGEQASRINLVGYGTTKKQSAFSVAPRLYLGEGTYRLSGHVGIELWPANFYGVGNDSPDVPELYEVTNTLFSAVLERRLPRRFMGGLVYLARREDMAPEPGGLLETSGVAGSSGGTYGGFGIRIGFDSRDNTNAAHRGSAIRYQGVAFDPSFGSDLTFRVQRLDLRHYRTTPSSHTLALACSVRLARGEVPFRFLSTPDGVFVLRGIEKGRYIDRDLLAVQTEYRFPTTGVWGMTVFGCLAQVTPRIEDVHHDGFKTSIGIGLRYGLRPQERSNIRADVGWVDGHPGVILELSEAF